MSWTHDCYKIRIRLTQTDSNIKRLHNFLGGATGKKTPYIVVLWSNTEKKTPSKVPHASRNDAGDAVSVLDFFSDCEMLSFVQQSETV